MQGGALASLAGEEGEIPSGETPGLGALQVDGSNSGLAALSLSVPSHSTHYAQERSPTWVFFIFVTPLMDG